MLRTAVMSAALALAIVGHAEARNCDPEVIVNTVMAEQSLHYMNVDDLRDYLMHDKTLAGYRGRMVPSATAWFVLLNPRDEVDSFLERVIAWTRTHRAAEDAHRLGARYRTWCESDDPSDLFADK